VYKSKNIDRKLITYFMGLFILCLSLILTSMSRADVINDLYEVNVLVAGQTKEERNKSLQQAFMQILVRISGRADIIKSNDYPNIQGAIEVATRYAQQYRYLKYQPKAGADPTKKLILWVRFDETAVTSLLRSDSIAIWGYTRPATLVWLVVDNQGQRELIGNNSQHVARTALIRQARLRGVPLRLPLLDLTDQTALRASDVWGNFESPILKASKRYQTEAVLVGRVFQTSGARWNVRWSLYTNNRRQDYSVSGASIGEVLRPGVNATAEALAARYALVGQSDTRTVLLQVRDINDLSDYNRVSKYLNKLSNINMVQPFQLSSNMAIFKLTTSSDRSAVERAVALGHTLIVGSAPIPRQSNGGEGAKSHNVVPDLIYRLIP